MLHQRPLLPVTPVPFEGLKLRNKSPRELVQCAFRAVLLRDIVRVIETAGELHVSACGRRSFGP